MSKLLSSLRISHVSVFLLKPLVRYPPQKQFCRACLPKSRGSPQKRVPCSKPYTTSEANGSWWMRKTRSAGFLNVSRGPCMHHNTRKLNFHMIRSTYESKSSPRFYRSVECCLLSSFLHSPRMQDLLECVHTVACGWLHGLGCSIAAFYAQPPSLAPPFPSTPLPFEDKQRSRLREFLTRIQKLEYARVGGCRGVLDCCFRLPCCCARAQALLYPTTGRVSFPVTMLAGPGLIEPTRMD